MLPLHTKSSLKVTQRAKNNVEYNSLVHNMLLD